MRYWSARVTGGHGQLVNEIDEVAWLDVTSAHARLDYARDRDQLLALVRLQQTERLDTWPLVLVRHAHAVARGDWRGDDDTTRPLDPLGRERAEQLGGVLTAYGVTRARQLALGTLRRHDRAVCHRGRGAPAHPARAVGGGLRGRTRRRHTATSPSSSSGASRPLLCTHGPVLPALLDDLERRLDLDAAGSVEVVEEFAEARDEKLVKGEAMVCHVVGTGEAARVVAVERHRS